jgi:hypothetical protein
MPNGFNAKYEEWKIWFERHIPFMRDGVILLGHSLGGIFLAKFLSENDFPKKINATLLVAAPYDAGGDYSLADFVIRGPLERFAKQGGEVYLYHSEDDPIVDSGELEKYKKKLPDATIRVFKDRGHFDQEEFPEIVEDIKKLAVQ